MKRLKINNKKKKQESRSEFNIWFKSQKNMQKLMQKSLESLDSNQENF